MIPSKMQIPVLGPYVDFCGVLWGIGKYSGHVILCLLHIGLLLKLMYMERKNGMVYM